MYVLRPYKLKKAPRFISVKSIRFFTVYMISNIATPRCPLDKAVNAGDRHSQPPSYQFVLIQSTT